MKNIKKSTYLLLGASLLISACSQEADLPGSENRQGCEPIIFSTSLPDISTRSEVMTKGNLMHFQATAFDPADSRLANAGSLTEYFDDEKILLDNVKGKYLSDNCIWPEIGREDDELTFFAFYPELKKINYGVKLINPEDSARLINNTTISGATTTFNYKLDNFRVAPDIADQVDFMAANASGSMDNNLFSGINLPFQHYMSRIEVKAWSAHKSCNIEIAGVRIGKVNMKGTFNFRVDNRDNFWTDISEKGIVEYIFRNGDKIVSLNKGAASTSTEKGAVSLMGKGNCAMLLPSDYSTDWNLTQGNTNDGLYISVLLRIIDATPYAGVQPKEKQRYPYRDLVQGEDALKEGISRVYLAVNASGIVSTRLYKKPGNYDEKDKNYFTDPDCKVPYTLKAGEEVKEFGWAAIAATGKWDPGYFYTYTLDYSHGIGLHDPEVTTEHPKAGDPIISDIVGMNVTVVEWKPTTDNCDFEVTGH